MKRLALSLLVCAVPAAASAAIVIERPEIRPPLGAQATAAAYMVIRNTGPSPDRLLSADCACAKEVMAHRSTTVNGVARMEMEMSVPVPAKGSVVFDARGRHLMLTGVKGPIRSGAKTPMVLTFEKAGKITVAFTATEMAGMAAMAGIDHQHAH